MTGHYEFAKTTQRMVVLVHMVTTIRNSPLPYVYLEKGEYARIGGVIPPKGQRPDPKDAILITVRRSDDDGQLR